MILSSTIKTLIGGTALLSITAGRGVWSGVAFFFLVLVAIAVGGRGEATLAGGVVTGCCVGIAGTGSCAAGGGVGKGGAEGT